MKRYLEKVTGLSRSQLTRLIGQHLRTGKIKDRRGKVPARPFERRYTQSDIRLLAKVDELLNQMSGLGTRAVLRREFAVYGNARFERLAGLSNGHLYNLRKSRTYRTVRRAWDHTRAPVAPIDRGVQVGLLPLCKPGKLYVVRRPGLRGSSCLYRGAVPGWRD